MVVISLRMVIRPFYDELFNYFDKKNCFFYNNIVNLLTRFRRVKLLIAEIAICDDEELVMANLQRKISTCFDTHNAPYNISCYTNARDLLKEVSKQITENNNVCIVAYDDENWIRINCQLIDDSNNVAVKQAVINEFDWAIEAGYTLDNPDFQVLYMAKVDSTIYDEEGNVISTYNF